jgi:hypothetical protein
MSRSGTFSSLDRGRSAGRRGARRFTGVVVLLALLAPWAAPARVLLDIEAALAAAFPDCEIERRTSYLNSVQLVQAREAAGVAVPSALVVAYVATCNGAPGGTAYFDAHRVRTLPETVMVVIDVEGRVERVEVLSFDEPPDYLPGTPWYRQFVGQALDSQLALQRDIDGITGATLTARATTEAVRRVLAVHEVLSAAGHPATPR